MLLAKKVLYMSNSLQHSLSLVEGGQQPESLFLLNACLSGQGQGREMEGEHVQFKCGKFTRVANKE